MTNQPEARASLAALLFLARTVLGAILAVELWHWRWALYGLVTALFVAVGVTLTGHRNPPADGDLTVREWLAKESKPD